MEKSNFNSINVNVKIAIVEWFTKNIDCWQRVNSCTDEFHPYIYGPDGEFLIGGEEIYDFIKYIDKAF